MAALTGNAGVLAIKMEDGIVMIEGGRCPAVGCVTGLALIAQRSSMRVIVRMTGGTVLRCAFEFSSHVTVLTGNCVMFADQREGKLGMIHLRQFPAISGMTQGTVGSKLTVVMVVVLVTGETRLRGRLQVVDTAGGDMALRTSHRGVLTRQLERHLIVIKVRAKRFPSVVAAHTVRAKGQEVLG